jgi:hypothetical protein
MRRRSIQPYLLLLVFGGPLVLAAIAYYGPWDYARQGGAEHGAIINPPITLRSPTPEQSSADWLRRRWSLIYASEAPCGAVCIGKLNRLNQVRLALGHDLGRAQVVMLFVGSAPVLPVGADVTLARLDLAQAAPLREQLTVLGLDRVFIADPLGRLVMSYPVDADQSGILEDLERMLSLSPFG